MKSSRKFAPKRFAPRTLFATAIIALFCVVFATRGEIPKWLQNIETGTPVENALFRVMASPAGNALALRPPREARPLLDSLVQAQPSNADLISLRAMEEEQQLDFAAAEKDWQSYAQVAPDHIASQLALADFYHRRARPADEVAALLVAAQLPSTGSETLFSPREQQSWVAFSRILTVIADNALPAATSDATYRAWMARYPNEAFAYTNYFQFLLARKNYSGATDLIAAYQKAFPNDAIFPVKAVALLDYSRGDVAQGLAAYDRSFQPLWPDELIQGYFSLMSETHTLRKFLDASQAAYHANPDDLSAAARLFYYYQQEGKPDAAQQVIDGFRGHKESASVAWKGDDLYTAARLLEKIQAYPEAARYYYALYNAPGDPSNRPRALVGLIGILLRSPDQPLRLGASDLSMYRDIGTADPGPGFLNGILSLLFNSEDPSASLADEEKNGVAYFHREEAARLLALLDQQYPRQPERAGLRVALIQAYVEYSENDAVLAESKKFLADFPDSPQRTQVSLLMADADARLGKTDDEFAVYDAALRELADAAQNVPLGAAASDGAPASRFSAMLGEQAASDDQDENDAQNQPAEPPSGPNVPQQFQIGAPEAPRSGGSRSAEYASVLDRYLARLAALKQLPRALEVLRREVDRNPNDPGLYERLAQFLQQNQLGAQEEEVYQRAIQQFPDRSWYHKLARLYLRQRRADRFEEITSQVTKIFAGSDLEAYFDDVVARNGVIGAQLYLQLNLYANQRFPHDLVFVRNLLGAYSARGTADPAAWSSLISGHWFENEDLRAEYFEYLSRTGQLDAQLAALNSANPEISAGQWQSAAQTNPAAVRFFAEAQVWQSHFESGLPAMGALAAEFPADADLGGRASALDRSLAYQNPENTDAAVRVQLNLSQADPTNRDTLSRIGDIYADRDLFTQATPYWNRMAEIEPGNPDSYVAAASVFWDYYKFDDALRLLDAGRAKLGDASLFSYEEGAIYENKRDYSHAIDEYVKGALASHENSESLNRLLDLARRPALKSTVDSQTARLIDPQNPAIGPIRLRVKVLDAQDRKADVRSLLLSAVDQAQSLELAEDLHALAQQESLDDVTEHAIEREAALTTDPVHRLELRYALVQFFESKKDVPNAQRNIEALYRENPRILGVVRSTVDFDWRENMRQQAVDVLLQAAKDSYPALRDQFNFEAARKATEMGNFALARQVLDPLLQQSPYDSQFLAAMADTYARQNDSSGLRDFYLAKIALFRQAPFAADERTQRVAELRRGLIPALTQLKDYTGAVDQYIEIVNAFPEDAGLTIEAALYAEKHNLQTRLTSYFAKAASDSPRNFRLPMILARLQTQFEDYPAAIASYGKSIAVRPDRTDLYAARADLLERLTQFDAAAADYSKLYDLSYHDPKWMVSVAEMRARQGNAAAAVAALNTAFIAGKPASLRNFFQTAQLLESWDLLPQARDFAQRGVDAAGNDLLANPANLDGAQLYVRILTRLRQQAAVYTVLENALAAAHAPVTSLSSTVQQVERQGIAAVADSQWRQREQQARSNAGDQGMNACLKTMGGTVAQYFTPEEKSTFSDFLAAKQNGTPTDAQIGAAQAAGLSDLESRWRYEALMASGRFGNGEMPALIALQSRRLKYVELAGQLENYAATLPRNSQSYVLTSAASAYRSTGDSANELRIYSELADQNLLGSEDQRYFELLFAQQPQTLVKLAGNPRSRWYDSATNFTVSSGDDKLAYAAIQAHGAAISPVWTKAYTGLAGLFFADPSTDVNSVFRDVLDDRPIGQRIGNAVDLNQQLAGNVWFYYGSRYGEYLGVTHQGNPEDYLPAVLEQSPGDAGAYLITARYYADAGQSSRAIADYQHSLELDPDQPDTYDRIGVIYWRANKHPEAIAEWKLGFDLLRKEADRTSVPESFWTGFASIAQNIGDRNLGPQFHAQIDALLRDYIRRNGAYNTPQLLRAAYSTEPGTTGVAWLLDLSGVAPTPEEILPPLVDADWISLAQRDVLYLRVLDMRQVTVNQSEGEEKDAAFATLRQWQMKWLGYLLETKQFQRAKDTLDALPPETRVASAADLAPIEIRIAAGTNTLDSLLATYRADPDHAPAFESLRTAVSTLQSKNDGTAARKILDFAYSREIASHNFDASNFLGLAEIRLETGDVSGALSLLNRLVLVAGQPFANLDSAASLLEKSHHPAEAAVFLAQLAKATPWQPQYRLRLARAQLGPSGDTAAAKALGAIAGSSEAPYAIRGEAASAIAGKLPNANLGSAELNLLAADQSIAPAQANHPYFTRARIVAAQRQTAAGRVDTLRSALEDDPSSDAARLQLFDAASETRQYQLAYSVAEPFGSALEVPIVSGDSEASGVRAGEPQSTDGTSTPVIASDADRVRTLNQLATAAENLNRLDDAARDLQSAEKLETNATRRAEIHRNYLRIDAEITRRATNASRQPQIHRDLEQDHLVRPRLTAASTAPRSQP